MNESFYERSVNNVGDALKEAHQASDRMVDEVALGNPYVAGGIRAVELCGGAVIAGLGMGFGKFGIPFATAGIGMVADGWAGANSFDAHRQQHQSYDNFYASTMRGVGTALEDAHQATKSVSAAISLGNPYVDGGLRIGEICGGAVLTGFGPGAGKFGLGTAITAAGLGMVADGWAGANDVGDAIHKKSA